MKTASGQRRLARVAGIAECTPNLRASYEAAQTTLRWPGHPTITGRQLPSEESLHRAHLVRWMLDELAGEKRAKQRVKFAIAVGDVVCALLTASAGTGQVAEECSDRKEMKPAAGKAVAGIPV